MQKLSINECSVKDQKVLVRVDFNVPLSKEGKITDDSRIRASLPTIQYILENGGSAILMSHLGRPKSGPSPELSLRPCAEHLSELLGTNVGFITECIGKDAQEQTKNLQPGQIVLLENLRFHQAEEKPEKDPLFAQQLASLGDLYVNDAFGTAHRAHSSTEKIAHFFPGKAAMGFLLEKEIDFLDALVKNPSRPFHAIIGGSKISSKIGVLTALITKVDALLIGGGMAYTFLKAQGFAIGSSICEEEYVEKAKAIISQAESQGVRLLLPIDHVTVAEQTNVSLVNTSDGIPSNAAGVDIGPKTISEFLECLFEAKTIFWNGPLGIYEDPRFSQGTLIIAKALPTFGATTVVGGGDSLAAVRNAGVAEQIDHLSTGGGASLEYLEFGTLPGIEALSNRL